MLPSALRLSSALVGLSLAVIGFVACDSDSGSGASVGSACDKAYEVIRACPANPQVFDCSSEQKAQCVLDHRSGACKSINDPTGTLNDPDAKGFRECLDGSASGGGGTGGAGPVPTGTGTGTGPIPTGTGTTPSTPSLAACPQGGCAFDCTAGSCAYSCEGGDCSVTCRAGTTCTASCDGGGCKLNCEAGAKCDGSCNGGKCAASCSGDCSEAGCKPGTCTCVGAGCE